MQRLQEGGKILDELVVEAFRSEKHDVTVVVNFGGQTRSAMRSDGRGWEAPRRVVADKGPSVIEKIPGNRVYNWVAKAKDFLQLTLFAPRRPTGEVRSSILDTEVMQHDDVWWR